MFLTYTVFYSTGSTPARAVNATSMPYTLTGLEFATQYDISVAVVSTGGIGPESGTQQFTTLQAGTFVVVITSFVYNQLLLDISAVMDSDGGPGGLPLEKGPGACSPLKFRPESQLCGYVFQGRCQAMYWVLSKCE